MSFWSCFTLDLDKICQIIVTLNIISAVCVMITDLVMNVINYENDESQTHYMDDKRIRNEASCNEILIMTRDIGDDMWFNCLLYLNVNDFFCTNMISIRFNKLTNDKLHFRKINEYWHDRCQQLCYNVKEAPSIAPYIKDWKSFYYQIIDFYLKYWAFNYKPVCFLSNCDNEYHEHVCSNQFEPLDLIADSIASFVVDIIFHDNLEIFLLFEQSPDSDIYIKRSDNKDKGWILISTDTQLLGYCAQHNCVKITQYLLHNTNMNPNYQDWISTALLDATFAGHVSIVRLLLDDSRLTKEYINAVDFSNTTALQHAVKNSKNDENCYQIARLLLNDCRTDVNAETDSDKNLCSMIDKFNVDSHIILLFIRHDEIDIEKHCLDQLLQNCKVSAMVKQEIRQCIFEHNYKQKKQHVC